MNDPFLEALRRELSAAGIRGSQRERILAEYEDHLACDPNALLGSPSELARQFADELGTSRARRAATSAFAALALAGGLTVGAFASANLGPLKSAEQHPLARAAAAVLVIAAQLAFATGVLAALRSFWRRRVASDLFDGIARGVMEAAACLLGFAALGPYVGLWSPSAA
jgi:hypothetical protein